MKLTGFKLILVIILFAAALSVIAISEFTEIMPSEYTGGIISRLLPRLLYRNCRYSSRRKTQSQSV